MPRTRSRSRSRSPRRCTLSTVAAPVSTSWCAPSSRARKCGVPIRSSIPQEWPLRIVRVHARGRLSRHLAEQVRAGTSSTCCRPTAASPRTQVQPGGTTSPWPPAAVTVLPVVQHGLLPALPGACSSSTVSGTGRVMCLEELLALRIATSAPCRCTSSRDREPQEWALQRQARCGPPAQLRREPVCPRAVQEYFICGPGDMIDTLSATLRELESSQAHPCRALYAGRYHGRGSGATTPSKPATRRRKSPSSWMAGGAASR